MTDIVERLRESAALPTGLYAEAADEIERLQKALNAMTAAYADAVEQHNQTLDELNKIEAAAKNLISVRGRHHAEQAYKRLEESLK